MTLNCTLVGGPGSPRIHPPVELSIDAPPGTAGSEIHDHLVREFSAGAVTVDGQDLRSLVVGIPPLVEAAILVDGATPLRRRPARPGDGPGAPLALTVDTGAAAGTVVPLRRGSYSIGRSGTRIVIPDPELSREHARVVVTDTAIMLIDMDSANGTYVDGERIRSTVISTKSSIRCGQSNLSLVFADVPAGILADAGKSVAEPIVVSGRVETGNRIALLVTIVLPLALGVLLATLTGMWMFLAFSVASAFSVLVPALGGRRQRRELSAAVGAAVEEDKKRRRRCAPPLSLVAMAAERGKATSLEGSGADGNGIWLQVGQAEQAPNVRIEPAGSARAVPPGGMAPVLLDPERPLTTVGGPRFATDGVIRSLLMQLAGYPRAGTTHVVVHGHPRHLPLAARYLPEVTLTATTDAGLKAVNSVQSSGRARGVLLIRGEPSGVEAEHLVREAALERGWQVLHFLPDEAQSPVPDVRLSERASVVLLKFRETAFVPDLVPEEVFTRFCRRLAGESARGSEQGTSVPAACSLSQVLPLTPAATAQRWESSAQTGGLATPLGLSASGTKFLDLQADGPHLLVAGTTGSGKSELLRSLTLALALSHPPERINFFFFDFKGGSGLGPLSRLVHCVGLQTDLSTGEMDRTLASLRAEVQLRERCLSAARVPDIPTYHSTSAARDFVLPHLVIVIDEFRMLVDDAPEALRELLRIASIGRSLGIHLVMATQRPQGALTADIRANVTSSIALRVQSDMESMDIVNSRDAAAISVDSPGRAFLARGAEAAEEFQGACLAAPSGAAHPAAVEVRRTLDYLTIQASGASQGPAVMPTPAQAVEPLTAMVQNLWAVQAKPPPRRPVAPPLPEQLEDPHPDNPTCGQTATSPCPTEALASPGQLRLGLLDVPEKQKVEALAWSPAQHGHAAFIGSPTSGAAEGLQLTVHKLLVDSTETHMYFLDAPGVFVPLADAARTGAHAGLHDLRLGVRILERLVRELGRRLSSPGTDRIPLALVISGWGSWVSAFRSGPLAWAEDLVHDLARDGAAARITLLLSGERELVTARFFGALPNRFYFPAGSTEENRAMWPRLPSIRAVHGRAAACGPVSGGGPAACQFYSIPAAPLECSGSPHYPPARWPPFRVEPLPATVTVEQVAAMAAPAAGHCPGKQAWPTRKLPDRGRHPGKPGTTQPAGVGGRRPDILLGVAGDEPVPLSFRLPESGVMGILGSAGSGKTNTLRALQALNPEHAWFMCPEPSGAAVGYWADLLERAEAGKVPRGTVFLVDDVDLLDPAAVRELGQLNALGFPAVVTASFSPVLLQRVPLMMNSRAAGIGLLLCPRSAADGDLFGSRFDIEPDPPPGRGILVLGGGSRPLQVAWTGAGT